MSIPKTHPVFVVRMPHSEGCGHQHPNRASAWNCAENFARRRKTLPWIEVVKVSMRGHGVREEVVGRVAQHHLCDTCKGYIFVIEGEERGHYEDCPNVAA